MKAYVVSHKAWYAKVLENTPAKINQSFPEIYIMDCPEDGKGVNFEFAIKWIPLGDCLTPKLEMFDDSWAALTKWPELFEALSEAGAWKGEKLYDRNCVGVGLEDIITILHNLGFVDMTPYEEKKNG